MWIRLWRKKKDKSLPMFYIVSLCIEIRIRQWGGGGGGGMGGKKWRKKKEREEEKIVFKKSALFNIVCLYIQFGSFQFKMVSMRSEKPICAPPRLSAVSPTSPLKQFQCSSD